MKRSGPRPMRRSTSAATGRRWRVWGVFVVPALALIAVLCDGGLPLGVPGEWAWRRSGFWPLASWAMVLLVAVGAAYLGLVLAGGQRASRASPRETGGWLTGLVAVGLLWILTLQTAAAPGCGLEKAGVALYHWCTSGYFLKARAAEPDLRAFLGGYERGISGGAPQTGFWAEPLSDSERVGHIGTHPPGMIVGFALLIRLYDHSPRLTQAVVASQPEMVRAYFDVMAEFPDPGAGPLLVADRAVLWTASMLTHVVAILALVPMYFLVRRTCGAEASWRAVAFWPTVPALAVFLPASDALLPCFGVTFLLLWLEGWERGSAVRCVLSGIVLWLGLFISLAMLPVAALAAAMTVWEGWLCDRGQRPLGRLARSQEEAERSVGNALRGVPGSGLAASAVFRGTPRRAFPTGEPPGIAGCHLAPGASLLRAAAWLALGMTIPTVLLWAWAGVRLPVVWFWNLSNHAAFYDSFSRTYWKWLLVNPIELAIAAGLPLTTLAMAAYRQPTKDWREKSAGPLWCCALVWCGLWLSGKNSGEAARLWIVLMPWPCWLAATGCSRRYAESPQESRHPSATWLAALALQLLLAVALVFAVNGFPHPQSQ